MIVYTNVENHLFSSLVITNPSLEDSIEKGEHLVFAHANALFIKRYQYDIVSLGLLPTGYIKISAILWFVQAQRTTPLTRTGEMRVQIRQGHILNITILLLLSY